MYRELDTSELPDTGTLVKLEDRANGKIIYAKDGEYFEIYNGRYNPIRCEIDREDYRVVKS